MGVFFDPSTGAVGWASDTDLAGVQPLDTDLTVIAGLSPSNDDIIQRKAGAWTNRSMSQLATDLSLSAYVPYTGATADVNLGAFDLAATLGVFSTSVTTPIITGESLSTDNLEMFPNSAAQPNAGLFLMYGHIQLDPVDVTFTTTPDPGVSYQKTYTLAYGGSKGGGFRDASTILAQVTSGTFFYSLFNTVARLGNASGYAPGLAPGVAFIANQIVFADGQSITQFKQNSYVERGVFETLNSGVLRTTIWNRYETDSGILGAIKSGAIVYEANAAKFAEPLMGSGGTLYKNRGLYLPGYASGRDENRAIKSTTGIWELADDTYQMNETKGDVYIDRTTKEQRRIVVSSGSVSTEAVEFYLPDRLQSGLYAYYRSDQANVGGVADGADITAEYDKAGNGRDNALGGGTDYPTFDADTGAFSNNKPATSFTAASTQSIENTRDASIVIGFTGNWSMWAVVSFKTVAAAMRIFCHNPNTTRGVGITAAGLWELRMGTGAATVSAGAAVANTMYLIEVRCTSTTQELYVNGALVTSGGAPQNLSQMVWGAHRTGAGVYSTPFNGDLYERGVYNAGIISSWTYWSNYKAQMNTRYGTAF